MHASSPLCVYNVRGRLRFARAVPVLPDESSGGGMGSGKEASTARRVHTWSVFSRVVVADTYPFNSGDQRELGRKWDGLPAPQSGGDFDTPYHLPPPQLQRLHIWMPSWDGKMHNAASMRRWDETRLHLMMSVVTYTNHLEQRMHWPFGIEYMM